MISKKNKPYLTVIKSYLVMFQKVAQSAKNHTLCNEVTDSCPPHPPTPLFPLGAKFTKSKN